MQIKLSELNVKYIIELLRKEGTPRSYTLAGYLEKLLETQIGYVDVNLDEIPF